MRNLQKGKIGMNDPYEKDGECCHKCGVRTDGDNATNFSWEHGLCSECYQIAVSDDPYLLIHHVKAVDEYMEKCRTGAEEHWKVIFDYIDGMIVSIK